MTLIVPSAEDSEEESVGELLEDSLIEESLDESEEEFSDKELSEILSDDTEPFCEESGRVPAAGSDGHRQRRTRTNCQSNQQFPSLILSHYLLCTSIFSYFSAAVLHFLAFEKYGKKNINSFYPIDIKLFIIKNIN